jgi:type II secretory pathway pseudopilin PulG
MKPREERGVALILVLGLMLVLAVVAVVVTLLAITERGLTASERQQRAAFEGAQTAVELMIAALPDTSARKGLLQTLATGIVVWNGDPSDSIPRKWLLAAASPRPVQGMERDVFSFYNYDVRGAGRYTRTDGVIVANKGVRATVEVGPYVVYRATGE